MKRILCFGDSNTWGHNPANKNRYDRDVRWTGVLRMALGDGYEIIEEGLNGRTTVLDDPIESGRSGLTYLLPCLESHRPLDLVIIMLGTNDLKNRFGLPASDIARGVRRLVLAVQNSAAGYQGEAPRVLLISPAPVTRATEADESFAGTLAKSQLLGRHYAAVAKELGCAFLEGGTVFQSSEVDGIHLEASEHAKLGRAVADLIPKVIVQPQSANLRE